MSMKGRVNAVGLSVLALAVAGVVAYKPYRKGPSPQQPSPVAMGLFNIRRA